MYTVTIHSLVEDRAEELAPPDDCNELPLDIIVQYNTDLEPTKIAVLWERVQFD